jgi:hypothetical protein
LWSSHQVLAPALHSTQPSYTAFTASLASYGYIVVGADHPYNYELLELPSDTLAVQFRNKSYTSAASLDGPLYSPILADGFQGQFFYMAANNSGNQVALKGIWGKAVGWKEAVVLVR